MHELSAELGCYLEQVLQPLEPRITRDAVRPFILETCREPDELAACWTDGDGYVEAFSISEPGGESVSLEVEGLPDVTVQ